MDLGLEGKVAIVAAASRGLGKAAAMELSREGARVAIAARNSKGLEAAAEDIRAETGGQVLAAQADVSKAADIDKLVDTVLAEYGRIDILVNNAGGPPPGVFTDMSDDDWLAAINLNLMSTIRLTRRVLPSMRKQKWGRVINITSVSVKQPIPTLILSNTARAGVVAMAKTLAGQVGNDGITVNNVCPGYTLTDRMIDLAAHTAEEEGATPADIIDRWAEEVPVGRLGQPEELGAFITFLASERAGYITGTTVQVDGGQVKGLL